LTKEVVKMLESRIYRGGPETATKPRKKGERGRQSPSLAKARGLQKRVTLIKTMEIKGGSAKGEYYLNEGKGKSQVVSLTQTANNNTRAGLPYFVKKKTFEKRGSFQSIKAKESETWNLRGSTHSIYFVGKWYWIGSVQQEEGQKKRGNQEEKGRLRSSPEKNFSGKRRKSNWTSFDPEKFQENIGS